MRLVGATAFGSEATFDRAPWKGEGGGSRILVLCLALAAYNSVESPPYRKCIPACTVYLQSSASGK